MARGRRWLRGEWREGRFSTRGLSGGIRLLALLSVAIGLASAALVVTLGFDVALPGGVVEVPGRFVAEAEPRALPHVLIAVLLLGFSIAAASLAWSAGLPGARSPRVTLAVVGLVDAALAGATLSSVGQVRVMEEALGQPPVGSSLAAAAGAVGLALSLAVAVVPMRSARGRPGLVAAVAGVPALLAGATYVVLGGTSGPVALEALIGAPDFPAVLSAQAGLAPSLRAVAQSAAFLLAPFAIWQAATWARASGGPIGQRIAGKVERRPWILWLLLTTKLGWLLAGYLGFLPTALGGWSPEWRESVEDGPIGWAIAVVLAGIAGWWLSHPHRRRISRLGFRTAAFGVAVGFASWSLVMGGLGLLVPVADALPSSGAMPGLDRCGTDRATGGPAYAILCLQSALADWVLLPEIATVAAALAVGAGLVVRRRAVPIGLFLVAVGVWALPRALNAARFLLVGDAPAGTDAPGTVELATLDTAVTLLVAVLAVGWWLRRGPRADPWVLALVLVVTTLLTRGSTLVLPGWAPPLFYVALIFPLLYELALDSEDLNRPSPDRPARVLQSVGLRAGALALLFVGLGAGFASPDDESGRVAFTLFAPPFAAWLVAGVVSARARTAAIGERTASAEAPAARPLILGTGAGVLALALLLGVSTVATPFVRGAATLPQGGASPSEAPSERSRALALLVRDRAVRDEIAALTDPLAAAPSVEELAALGSRMVGRAQSERGWMLGHPAAGCSQEAWDARLEELQRLEQLGFLLAEPITDVESWSSSAENALIAWFDAQETAIVALDAMVGQCRITAEG